MTSKKLFFILLTSIALLGAGLVGGAYLANTKLQQHSTEVAKKKSQIATLQQQQESLAKAKKQLLANKSLSNIAKSIVPQDKDQAKTVREIVNIAGQNGIKLGSITFPVSTLGTAKPGTGSSPSSATSKSTGISQLTPVKDIPGVYDLQIVVTSDTNSPVPYDKFIDFLDALEHNRRTALVSSININPDKKNRGSLFFTLTLDEYIKP